MTAVRLGLDHLDALSALEAAAQPLPWSEDQLLVELLHDDATVLGALIDGELVGYIALRRMLEELWVLNLAVQPTVRRRGVALQLIQAAVARATELACTSLWLEVREGNAAARALYARCGFSERGRRAIYYPPIPPATDREPAVLMAREI